MEFEGTLKSVCDYLEITNLYSEKLQTLLSKIEVTNIECDSRRVTRGTIFYAKVGAHYNPFEHLDEIKAKGAVAVIIDSEHSIEGLRAAHKLKQAQDTASKDEDKSERPDYNDGEKARLSNDVRLDTLLKKDYEEMERLVREGHMVFTKYESNPKFAAQEHRSTLSSAHAKAVAESGLMCLVLPGDKSLSGLAGFIYGDPSKKLRLIGVTGTNGKSTITHLIAQMLSEYGHKCAILGTLGYGFYGQLTQSSNTTLDAISMQRELANFVKEGADYAIMEVSSIGFCEGRVSSLTFYAGAFTNLSRDHLDYHVTMEEYFSSKFNFLRMIPVPRLVVNAKDEYGKKIIEAIPGCYTVNFDASDTNKSLTQRLNIKKVNFNPSSQEVCIAGSDKKTYRAELNLLGAFNTENYAVALGVLLSMGYDFKSTFHMASKLKPITGRMECFSRAHKPRLIVDYAHTPDGVEQALKAVQNHNCNEGRVYAIVGCGGDRDPGKRPIMARMASVHADYAIFTADNPRSESLDSIIEEMMLAIISDPEKIDDYQLEIIYKQLDLLFTDGELNKELTGEELVPAAISGASLHAKAAKITPAPLCNRGALKTQNLPQDLQERLSAFYKRLREHMKKLKKEQQIATSSKGEPQFFPKDHLKELGFIKNCQQLLSECAEYITYEQYERMRSHADKGICTQAEKGEYYLAHKDIFGTPTSLPEFNGVARNVIIIKDRYQAIRFAFEHANSNDIILIAGKGHEDYQIFADKTIHFSDREICCELLGIKLDGSTNSDLDLHPAPKAKTSEKSSAQEEPKKQSAAKAPAKKVSKAKATTAKAPAKRAATKAPVKSTTAKAKAPARAKSAVKSTATTKKSSK